MTIAVRYLRTWCCGLLLMGGCTLHEAEVNKSIRAEKSPADDLPPYITHLTSFGERADWSLDGKRILFLEKTYGDVYEVEVAVVVSSACVWM